MQGDKERFLACGMDGYVSKPIKLEELFSVIANVIPNIHRGAEAKDLLPSFNVALAFMRAARSWPASRHALCPAFFSATAFNSTRALSIPSRDTFQCVTMRTE
jgi:DNA-binding response OmpR family regulator